VVERRNDRIGSGPVHHLTALNGGSTNHTGRLRSDDAVYQAAVGRMGKAGVSDRPVPDGRLTSQCARKPPLGEPVGAWRFRFALRSESLTGVKTDATWRSHRDGLRRINIYSMSNEKALRPRAR
jgi:hypothetical protein